MRKEDERLFYIRLMTVTEFWDNINKLPPLCPHEAEEIAENLSQVTSNRVLRAGPVMSENRYPYFARNSKDITKPEILEDTGAKLVVRLDSNDTREAGTIDTLTLANGTFDSKEAWGHTYGTDFFVRDWRYYCRCRLDGSFMRPIIPHWDGDPRAIADIDD